MTPSSLRIWQSRWGDSWLGDVEASIITSFGLVEEGKEPTRTAFAQGFLVGLPYLMCGLSVCILTGIFLRPALRLGAILFILLGLGKYIQNDVATTANDFLFALIICIGLYFLSLEKKPRGQPA